MAHNSPQPTPAVPPPLPASAQTPWRVWHFAVAWLGGLVGSILGLPFTNISFSGDPTASLTGTDTLAILLPAQLLGHIAAVAILVLVLKLPFEKGVGFDVRPRDGWFILAGAALSILVSLAVAPLANLLGATEDPQGLGGLIDSLGSGAPVFVAFLAIVVVTPMVEETLFRGILQRAIGRRLRSRPTIMVTAGIFSLAHVAGVPADNFWADATVTVASILVIGVVLSWLVERDQRLGRAIAVHTGFNLVSFVVLLVSGSVA